MTPQLWIGFGFAIVLVAFLIISFFIRPDLTHSQHGTIRFLSALCAAFAAGFITGGALFEYAKQLPDGGKIAFTGVAGFALFGMIWMTYPTHQAKLAEISLTVGIDPNWTFYEAAFVIAQKEQGVIELDGFTDQERNAKMKRGSLRGKTATDVLKKLRGLALTDIRSYQVELTSGIFRLYI
jgi:hypothetical protein